MNKYIVTCSIDGDKLSAVMFDSKRTATNFIQRTLKSLGAKPKRRQRILTDWDIKKHGVSVKFRLINANEEDISFVIKNDRTQDARQFQTRKEALKQISKSLHKITYAKGLGSGQWYKTKAHKRTSINLMLVHDSGSINKDYALLGLGKNATTSEIKKAYRKMVKSVHPDHGGTEQDMKDLTKAYNNIASGKSVPNEEVHQFQAVSSQFLSKKLHSALNNTIHQPPVRRSLQLGLRHITIGVGLVVFGIAIINSTQQTTNPYTINIIASGLIIFGIYYLITGLVSSIKN